MLSLSDKKVYLCCGYTDMRKSIKGLSAIVAGTFAMKPDCEAQFVFCNKKRDRIKILEWDGDGFWVYFKHQESGHYPWSVDGSKALEVTLEELMALIKGARLVAKLKGKDNIGEYML